MTPEPASISIRCAQPPEAAQLTALMRAAKAHWGYSAAQMAAWENDLLLEPGQIQRDRVHVAEIQTPACLLIAGFYTLVFNEREGIGRLEHFFVAPACQGRGIGKLLLQHARQQASLAACTAIAIDADPHAEVFYLGQGARRVAVIAAPIAGNALRIRPQLQIAV